MNQPIWLSPILKASVLAISTPDLGATQSGRQFSTRKTGLPGKRSSTCSFSSGVETVMAAVPDINNSGNSIKYFGGIQNEPVNSGSSQIRSSRSTRYGTPAERQRECNLRK